MLWRQSSVADAQGGEKLVGAVDEELRVFGQSSGGGGSGGGRHGRGDGNEGEAAWKHREDPLRYLRPGIQGFSQENKMTESESNKNKIKKESQPTLAHASPDRLAPLRVMWNHSRVH